MRNKLVHYAFVLVVALALASCNKDKDPAPPPVIGQWKLDKVVLSSFPAPYQSINRNYVPSVFGLDYELNLTNDKKFSYRISDGLTIDEGDGTWEYTSTTLKLDFADPDMDDAEYAYTETSTKKELTGTSSNVALDLENPTTGAEETVPGKIQLVFKKQ